MTSPKHYKLGAKPKWSAHADGPCMSGDESSTTPDPPWRDKSLWRITTTKTMEGLLPEEPNRGVKQKFEGLCEALTKKHAMEYESKSLENGSNEEDEVKDKGWNKKK